MKLEYENKKYLINSFKMLSYELFNILKAYDTRSNIV